MLEETFERNVSGFSRPANYTCDVQHGSVYQEFKLNDNEDTIPFTKEDSFNLLLLLNMDHFQPHQYSSYSVGGVWLSRKNTILSSILPGPREATQMEMTRLLKPLVDELNTLKHGVIMQDFSGREITVKACLVLVSADLPAIRKLMGVAAHNGICSCAFCDMQFSSLDNNQRDYSNMDIDTYPEWTKETHERNSANWLSARTQTDRDERKKATGTAYSVFQELAYFDCIKFQSVDVLHCSYLGICKRILRTIWLDISCTVEKNTSLLSTKDLKEMFQLLEKNFVFPFNFDGQSIHRKLLVGDGTGYLKGDEIRVFLLISPYLLQGRLPHAKYENFMKFVEINRLLNSPGLYTHDIQNIKQFMQDFLQLYGDAKYVAFNFHLFLHLPQAIKRYSTPCNYWLFFYERLNADLKGISTSNNSNGNIEKTFFDRFLSSVYSDDLFDALPRPASMKSHDIISESLAAMCLSSEGKKTGIVSDMMKAEYGIWKSSFDLAEYLEKEQHSSHSLADDGVNDEDNMFVGFEILPPGAVATIKINYAKHAFAMLSDHYMYLVDYYNATYSSSCQIWNDLYVGGIRGTFSAFEGAIFPVSNLIRKFKQVKLFSYLYKSLEGTPSKLKRGSYVLAYCRNDPTPESPATCLRPGQIVYFFRHATTVRDIHTGSLFQDQVHTFAFVRFFKQDDRNFTAFNRYHMPVCKNEFEEASIMSIVPLLRIHSPIAIKINHFENVNVFIDMPRSAF